MNTSSPERIKLHSQVINVAQEIPDPYVRAVTLARIGHRLYLAGDANYGKAFSLALSAINDIDNPFMVLKAMVDISKYFHLSGMEEKAKDLLRSAYEGSLLLKGPARDVVLLDIARGALAIGMPDEALLYSTDIQDIQRRDLIMAEVVQFYIKRGDLRRASSLLDGVSSEEVKSRISFELLNAYLRRGEFASALRILPKIEVYYWVDSSIEEIAKRISEEDAFEDVYWKFVEAITELSMTSGKDYLTTFLIGLSRGGKARFVAKVLNSLADFPRAEAVKRIAMALISSPRNLEEFIRELSLPPEEFDPLARAVMDELLKGPVSPAYREVALIIGRRTEDMAVLVKVSTYLSKIGYPEEARTFAEQIIDPYLRSLAFGAIALAHLKRGDIDSAIEAAAEVRDRDWGSWLMGEILVKVVESSIGENAEEELSERARKHKKWREDIGP
ncbi:hypothetical protein A3K92_01060 [Thermococcus gorgonarius]|uniref:Prenyltransferase n=1 Tax=Thermococcus gorgonarius TaxID=71997 RepID=A0A2Z2M524_THEGO|nr:hypothetical protein A3K92_01060 [Thermococcus gorgonarius]